MGRFHVSNDSQVKVLAFTGAACAVIAQAPPFPEMVRYSAAAIAAGCAAVVALMRQVGSPHPPEVGKG